jgi:hypothetical protein
MDTVVLSAALVTISEEFKDWRLAYWAVMSYSLAYASESRLRGLLDHLTKVVVAGGALFARMGDVCGHRVWFRSKLEPAHRIPSIARAWRIWSLHNGTPTSGAWRAGIC